MPNNIELSAKTTGIEIRHDEETMEISLSEEKVFHLGVDAEMVDDARLKAIKRKIDIRICLILGLLYTISLLDRTNLPNAVVAGMSKELKLAGNAYSLLILVFFPFYILFQPPMTVIARKMGPRLFLSSIVISWGLVMVGHGLVENWKVMLGLRCLLGIFEAGFFSSCVYLLSTWYIRREVAKRNAAFYLLGSTLAGFGGILAYGLSQMNGLAGKAGWRWIFIMEGTITCAMGVASYFLVVDFPEKALDSWKFLKEDELKIIIDRVDQDSRDVALPPFHLGSYLRNALDWKVYFYAANFGLTSLVSYAVAYFLPIVLLDGLHFSTAAAQCLSAPCYVFASLLGFAEGAWSDKANIRTPFILFNCIIAIVGVALLGFLTNNAARYFGAFLIVGGANANIPLVLTYQSNNITGQWRRAFCSAIIVMFGGTGGIIGSLTFRSQDAPNYRPGLYTCFTAAALVMISVTTTSTYFYIQNKKQAKGQIAIEGLQGFRYTY